MKKSEVLDSILKLTDVTHGRVSSGQVFRDFIGFVALYLSNCSDPVHMDNRMAQQNAIIERYTPQEIETFHRTLQLLTDAFLRNLKQGIYMDLLGPVHQHLHPKSGPLKQNFASSDVAKLLGLIATKRLQLPEKGYFTCMEPTCGSGILCLEVAQSLALHGYNPCEQLVIQASDLDSLCVHMTYIQLSFYGIPAVVIQGNALSLEEYDRWYTPLYLIRNWVWREPMPFRPGRNKSDELLKMASEPWYAIARGICQPRKTAGGGTA